MFWFACHDSRNSGMVFVTTSISTPRSVQIRKRACVSAVYWFSKIGCTETRIWTGSGSPADRTISIAFSRGRCACRRPASCPRIPGGITPVAGRANRPSAPQTRSWVRTAPASASRRPALDLSVGGGRDAGDAGPSLQVLRDTADRDEGSGHLIPGEPNRALEGCLDGRGGQGSAVREHHTGAQVQPHRPCIVLESPL